MSEIDNATATRIENRSMMDRPLSIKAVASVPYYDTSDNCYKEQEDFTCASVDTDVSSDVGIFKRIMGDIYASDDPKVAFSQTKKNVIVLLVAVMGINGSIAQLIYMPGIYQMMEDLNTSLLGIDATVSAYIAFAGIAPLFWSSMSDAYGRKQMYLYSLFISVLASIVCAFSTNIAMLIVFRAIQASGATSSQTLGAGVISDMFDVTERGRAYGLFFVGPLLATVIGPTVGGFLCQYLGWRSTFYFAAIFAGSLLIMSVFLLPETLRKPRLVIDGKVSKPNERFVVLKNMRTVFGPMAQMILDPTVIVITLYNTVIYASLFFLNPSITDTFQQVYHFNSWQVGLCYLCLGISLICSSILSGTYADYIIKKLYRTKGAENVEPEMRLKAAYPSFILIPTGFLIYGWATQYAVEVYAPLIGIFIYGLGQMNSLNPTSVYLVDSKPGRSASAVAINNCVRSIAAAIVAIFSTTVVRMVGTGIMTSILAALGFANGILLISVRVYGHKWRGSFENKTGTTGPSDNRAQEANDRPSTDRV